MDRRSFLKNASLAAAYVAVGCAPPAVGAKGAANMKNTSTDAYVYRSGFGCWINDMRNEPLPFEGWPAMQLDDVTVDSITKCLDVQKEAGFNMFDVWGLFATNRWPMDIVSAVDPDRKRRAKKIIKAARDRGITPVMGFGNYSWGYEEIMEKDPSVRGKLPDGKPHPNAMCDANPKSFEYVKKILDFTLSEFDFGAVHLESSDLGYCQCPECCGKYGIVGYNCRINAKAADYIKSKWPDKTVYVMTISWTPVSMVDGFYKQATFTEADKASVIDLSSHVDCIFDQGHHGYMVDPADRREFIKKLQSAYGTSCHIWQYHHVQRDRLACFIPYTQRTGKAIQDQYADGVRGGLFYQGPVVNPAVEANIAVGGRMLSDASRDVGKALEEVVEVYYRPRSPKAHKRMVDVFLGAEEAFFSQMHKQGEFHMAHGRMGLFKPWLDDKGRLAYLNALLPVLKDVMDLDGQFDDHGRVTRIKQCLMTSCEILSSMSES